MSGAVKAREIEMLTAGGGPTSSSEVSRSRLGIDVTAGCEVKAFPRTMFECWEVGGVGGLSQPWVG